MHYLKLAGAETSPIDSTHEAELDFDIPDAQFAIFVHFFLGRASPPDPPAPVLRGDERNHTDSAISRC